MNLKEMQKEEDRFVGLQWRLQSEGLPLKHPRYRIGTLYGKTSYALYDSAGNQAWVKETLDEIVATYREELAKIGDL